MITCIGSTKEVNNICKLAEDAGYMVKKTSETVVITVNENVAYKALLKEINVWIVRYDPGVFVRSESDE